jgi:lipopolysaccharide export system permease protein
VIGIIGKKMSQEGALPAYIGMWIATAITIPVGIFLTSKATSDSSLFDIDAYTNFLKKLLPKKR